MIWAIVAILVVVLLAGFMLYQMQAALTAANNASVGGILNKGIASLGL